MNSKTMATRVWMGAIALVLLLGSGCRSRELASGLNEQDAQEIVVVLKQNGIDAAAVRTAGSDRDAPATWTVNSRGSSQEMVLAWRILQENGLPRQKVKGLEEVFSSTGMIPTAGEEKARLLLALSGELSRTLKSIQGVVDARVQLVLPENSPLLDRAQWSPPTASVLLKYRGSQTPVTADEVKSLVARGIEGLQADNVAVVFKRTEPVQMPQRSPTWYLSDPYLVMAAVGLMLLASAGSLLLMFRGRRLRATIADLESQLKAVTERSAVSA
jgi:type III secretion protein J